MKLSSLFILSALIGSVPAFADENSWNPDDPNPQTHAGGCGHCERTSDTTGDNLHCIESTLLKMQQDKNLTVVQACNLSPNCIWSNDCRDSDIGNPPPENFRTGTASPN